MLETGLDIKDQDKGSKNLQIQAKRNENVIRRILYIFRKW